MALGFRAKWVAVYNRATNPSFSVGEYWADQGQERGWIWETATTQGDLKTASSAFDFSTFGLLKGNKGNYGPWYGSGLGVGLIGDNSDGLAWKNRSVTFIENHDTAYRTNPDGSRKDNLSDSYANNWEVEQAYAQILTHPGVPTVFWKHYFDWGQDLRSKIQAMINARKVAGVHAGSELNLQDNARQAGVYAARVAGRNELAAIEFELRQLSRVRRRFGLEGLGRIARQPGDPVRPGQASISRPRLSAGGIDHGIKQPARLIPGGTSCTPCSGCGMPAPVMPPHCSSRLPCHG
jgi:hypothetical protein